MGYQALLFCPDEKLARVVTQVFTDLDFQVEAVNEPFGAVKKLMAQRYDAVVVDCENEQNATLLFKSARNSSSNQNSLALALVEGQAGVAKAYRIGANLVLTKPINVEQAKGTLRVARGLLRKNADAAGTPAPASAPRPASTSKPAVAAPASTGPTNPVEPAVKPSAFEAPAFESALPAMAASANSDEIFIEETASENAPFVAEPTMQAAPQITVPEPPKPVATSPSISAPAKPSAPAPSISHGAAAATAPAKEAPATEKRKTESDLFEVHETSAPAPRAAEAPSAPAFSGFADSYRAESSGGSKKIIAIAAAVIVAAALGYVGWTKFGKTTATTAQPVAVNPAPAQSTAFTAPSPAPASSATEAAPSTMQSAPPSAPISQSASKPSASINTTAATKIATVIEPVVPKPEPAPIRVKTQAPTSRPKPTAEEAAPQVPSPLGVGAANDKSLSGLVASTPVNIPRPAVGTLKISQGVSQGLLINRVQPRYPSNALAMRIQGSVQLEATISKEGKITNLKPSSGDPVLARAAMDAVRQWRYKPYFLDGEPVEIQTQITVNFKLPN